VVDGVLRPSRLPHRRQRGLLRLDEGPVRLVIRAGRNPAAERVHLGRRELLLRLGRRHQLVVVRARDAADEFARIGFAGDEGALAGLRGRERGLAEVEAETGLARVFVRPVAGEALAGKDGADFALEVRRGRGGGAGEI